MTARRGTATGGARRVGAWRLVGLVLASLFLATTPALAQSYVCNDLAAKLATLQKRPASAADRWSGAVAEQRQAIEQNRAAQARCVNPADPRCAAISERGRQMAANLAVLERQQSRLGGDAAGASAEEARIRTLMTQLRCGEKRQPGEQPITASFDGTRSRVIINGAAPGQAGVSYRIAAPGETPSAPQPRREPQGGLFGFLFGGNSAGDPEGGRPGDEQVIDSGTAQLLTGSYRTLCVRTCDGYFFPISFNASQGRLRTDANVCKALCPGTETRLYYHINPGQEAEQAIAADGTGDQLTRLPNAFRYRNEKVSGCTCGKPDLRLLPPGAGGLLGTRDAARSLQGDQLPVPARRPDLDQDPETQAVAASGLIVVAVSPTPIVDTVADATAQPGRPVEPPKVRVVGPKYFSDR